MSLDEMLQQYEALLQKKDELAEATKKNNQAIEEMKKSISDEMVALTASSRPAATTCTACRTRPSTPSSLMRSW